MAEIFLGAFVNVLVEKLASGDLWNFARTERIGTQLTKWKSMLAQVQAVVADAEEKQITDLGVNLWLSDLEDLSYDMDDVLDEFATEALRRKVMEEPRASTSKVRKLIPSCCTSFNPSTLVSDFRMRLKMDEMNEITSRLQDLFDRRKGLGLKNIAAGGSGKASQRRPTSALIIEPCLYGRDNDKKVILELLLSDQSGSNKVGVVPIVGMGGVGKTTLAQMVYNDEMVDKHFEMKAWVCVSEVFDIVGVTKAILEFVTKRAFEFKALAQVQDELKKALAGKKFLVVLDDVWNEDHSDWSSLKSPFNDGALGSKIIVTTRSRDVASIMAGINKYHFLTELSEDDCWSLFAQHAFEDRSMDANPNLVSIGQKIIKKCKGLPLAARTLGGLLRCKLTEDEWEGILNSKIWELSEERSHILPALRLSYYHLPSHLKKCFAYCSILPKDYEFEEEELVYLWMAEGLIPKQTGQRKLEDLGCEYFQELVSRSFFQPSHSSELFVMHDLINDLAQFFARKTCFRLEDKLKENEGDESISKARHSSYTRGDRDGIKKFEAFKKAKNLRTFLPCGSRYHLASYLTSDVPLRLLPGLKRLRVLSLRRYHIGLENVADALNARRANLKDKQGLNVLSMEWSNISNNSRNGNVESRVIDMLEPHKKLNELSINGYGGFTFPNWVGNSLFSNMVCLKFRNCEKCTSLPPLGQLPSLARLYIRGMKAVCNVGLEFYGLGCPNPFPSLEILTFDDMPEWKEWTPFGVEEGAQAFARLLELSIKRCPKLSHELPRNLPQLRNLYIEECPVLVVAWIPSPTELNEVRNTLHLDSLVSLCLKDVLIADSLGSSEVGDQVVLKNSSHSLWSSLTSLEMGNIRGHTCLPSWVFQGLMGIQELSLCGFKELTTLWDDEVRLQNCLPALRRLTIKHCPKLTSLFAGGEQGDDLKSLQELSIRSCPCLISFPVLSSTLKELWIIDCDRLVSLPDLTLLNNLEKLYLLSCRSLTCLSSGSGLPPALKELTIDRCAELKSLIADEGIKINCPSLESIYIYGCEGLKTLPDVMQNNNGLKNLSQLGISNCKNLESLPEGWFPTTNFRYFNVYRCKKLEPLPNHAYNNNRLASVEELSVGGFPADTGLLSHILDEGSSSNFTNLTKLTIYDVDIGKLCGLRRLYSLRELSLEDCDWVSFPVDGMLPFPSSLVELRIRRVPNLEKLSFKDFEILVSLERLEIINCPKLTSISELRLPPSLSVLYISGCPKLASFPEQGLPPSLSDLQINGFSTESRPCTYDSTRMCKPALSSAVFSTISFLFGAVTSEVPSRYLCKIQNHLKRGSSGIRAKAADVGADIIDKVERNIPDDDPRIERYDAICFRVIADIVGEIAGMGYDLVGFYAELTCAALVFGSISSFGINHNCNALSFAH
ncbi:hypothetical protein RHSIM_Rhsim01G0057200 [Rhododendron simsii]|uniref:H(+)-exporting diphosphatase n=1 Tax=Rhododendron simsii TaxID=118357 RepID=A0A834LYJ1_RHOSS|nr:hypothetical protein RHSIM_Rhsim01G0057200 [Rhododendron simsii]